MWPWPAHSGPKGWNNSHQHMATGSASGLRSHKKNIQDCDGLVAQKGEVRIRTPKQEWDGASQESDLTVIFVLCPSVKANEKHVYLELPHLYHTLTLPSPRIPPASLSLMPTNVQSLPFMMRSGDLCLVTMGSRGLCSGSLGQV